MNIKKSIFSVLVGFLVFILLAACGNNETTNGTSIDNNELAQGVTENEILVGHTAPQTGPLAIYDSTRKSIESYFKYVNENGGVNGRKLKLIAYDDQYQPAKTVQLAKRLVEEDKVFAILGPVGSAPNKAVFDYYVEKGIPVIMVGSGLKEFVDPPKPNYMGSSIANYQVEARVLLDYAVIQLGVKKIAIAYQNDDLGKEGYETVREAVKEYARYGIEIVETVNFLATDVDLSSQAQKIKEANPDAIITFSTPNPAANLKKAMYKIGLKDVPYIVSSAGADDTNLFNLAGKEIWEGTISISQIPKPGMSEDESLKLYVERVSQDHPDMPLGSTFSQTGWAQAEVFVEALKRTEGNLTWENFLKAFYTFDHWDGSMYEGVTFSEDNHYGLLSLFITEARDGNIVPITNTINFDPSTGKITYN